MAVLKLYKLAYLIPAFALTGCFTDFDPKEASPQVLCVNALVTADEPIETKLSHTWTYTDIQGEIDHEVNDGQIEIYANGSKVENDYRPQPGDVIKIEANSPKYGRSSGEVTVPVNPSLSDLKVDVSTSNIGLNQRIEYESYWDPVPGTEIATITEISFSFTVELAITVSDPSPERNYFRLASRELYNVEDDTNEDKVEIMYFPGRLLTDSEPIFSEHLDPIDALNGNAWGFTFFTDRRFERSDYTIRVSYETSHFIVRFTRPYKDGDELAISKPDINFINAAFEKYLAVGIDINLETVSESYYNWANYTWQIEDGIVGDLNNFGLTDPIWGYSNTTSGAGVVAARNPVSKFIDLRPDLLEALKQSLNK